MQLYVFNREMEYQGVIESFTSFTWTRKYNKVGEFELHIALTPHSRKLLQRENIIFKPSNKEAGFIEYVKFSRDEEGKEILVVSGKFVTGYLNLRTILRQETLQDTVEKNIRKLVDLNCINPTDTLRKIDKLELGTLKNYTKVEQYQTEQRKSVLEEVEKMCLLDDLGFKTMIDIQNKKLIFDVYKGKDKSVNQSDLPRVVFSKEFENVLGIEYVDSINNYRNVAIVGGMEDLTATPPIPKKFVTVGDTEASGLDRYEVYIDASNTSNKKEDNTIISDEDYTKILESVGNMNLGSMKELKSFDCKINPYGNLKYRTDYDLGDIVTIMSKDWGLTINKRITEIQEIYEQDGFMLSVTFGEAQPTLLTKIKQIIN